MKKFICLMLTFCLMGCTTHVADLTLVSNQNVSLNRVNLDKLPQTRNVTGSDKAFVLLFIPLGQPTLKNAVSDALNKADGDLMIDTSVDFNHFWFLIGWTEYQIRGTVVKTRGGK